MSCQARAFGVSFALHAAALLAIFGLSVAAERSQKPRIIDLSVLLPARSELAASPERPPQPAAPASPPRTAPPRVTPSSLTPPATPSPAALAPPAESVEQPTPVIAAPHVASPSREDLEEDAVPGGEAVQVSATLLPEPAPSPGATPEAVPRRGGVGNPRPAIAVTAASAAPAGNSGGTGNAGVPWDVAALRAIIKRHLVYPSVARRMGWEGKLLLSFVICGNGQARDIIVLESSGRDLLDRSALETVSKISSFPASSVDAKVIVPVVYQLN